MGGIPKKSGREVGHFFFALEVREDRKPRVRRVGGERPTSVNLKTPTIFLLFNGRKRKQGRKERARERPQPGDRNTRKRSGKWCALSEKKTEVEKSEVGSSGEMKLGTKRPEGTEKKQWQKDLGGGLIGQEEKQEKQWQGGKRRHTAEGCRRSAGAPSQPDLGALSTRRKHQETKKQGQPFKSEKESEKGKAQQSIKGQNFLKIPRSGADRKKSPACTETWSKKEGVNSAPSSLHKLS